MVRGSGAEGKRPFAACLFLTSLTQLARPRKTLSWNFLAVSFFVHCGHCTAPNERQTIPSYE